MSFDVTVGGDGRHSRAFRDIGAVQEEQVTESAGIKPRQCHRDAAPNDLEPSHKASLKYYSRRVACAPTKAHT